MKYKIIGVIATITAVIFSIINWSSIFQGESVGRYIEHLDVPQKPKCEKTHTQGELCTHLPVIVIDTDGVEIPGKPIVDTETRKITSYTTAADGSEIISAKTYIFDNENENNHLSDKAVIESNIKIRIRGNSSRLFDKVPYLIELVNEDGTNNPLSVMGMDAHHEWALHGPFLDKTLMRNYMWYNISGEIMDYAPNVRYCELVLNGEYQGIYLMTETITAGDDSRIPLSFDRKDNTYTGYILRHDRGSDNPLKNIQPFSVYALRTAKNINIVYPSGKNLTEELSREISLDFSAFEKTLYSYDFDDKKVGYVTSIDVDSFVDYFIINEVTLNRDAGIYSTYIYTDTDRKYKMCVWDFNNALDNYEGTEHHSSGFTLQEAIWFNKLIQDKNFTEKVIKRYKSLRKTILSDEYLNEFIEETIMYLGTAVDRNYEKWGYVFEEGNGRLLPAERNPRSFEEAVSDMKECLFDRLLWLDENIETLRQYSAISKTHDTHEQ